MLLPTPLLAHMRVRPLHMHVPGPVHARWTLEGCEVWWRSEQAAPKPHQQLCSCRRCGFLVSQHIVPTVHRRCSPLQQRQHPFRVLAGRRCRCALLQVC